MATEEFRYGYKSAQVQHKCTCSIFKEQNDKCEILEELFTEGYEL